LSEEENAGLERIRLEFERQLALRGEQSRQPRAEMSAVLYARVSAETKAAIDAFAGANGRAVAAAVAELLSRGLQLTSKSGQLAELQERLQRAELALARKDVELLEAKLALESFLQGEGERSPTTTLLHPAEQH
jgi:ADP-ribose pyrophosphatase YjhB (NUDIX family)